MLPLLLAPLALLSLAQDPAAPRRPNILSVFSDDHAVSPIGAYDGWLAGVNPTPSIDALANDRWNPSESRANDASGFHNLARMTPEQRAAWDAAFGPENAAFRAARLEGEALVRWKLQRYLKNYLRCVRGVDECVGRLLAWLDANGLAENTVVVYSSDQGFFLGEHGWFDKRWMYEESLRMPLIVRWPGVTAPGSRNRDLVQNVDYAETFLEMAGAPVPLLRGETPADWRDALYYHYFEFPGVHAVARHRGVRTRTHKLIHFYPLDEWELYDLERDPDELHNVHGDPAHAEVEADLRARLEALREEYGDDSDLSPLPAAERARLRGEE